MRIGTRCTTFTQLPLVFSAGSKEKGGGDLALFFRDRSFSNID